MKEFDMSWDTLKDDELLDIKEVASVLQVHSRTVQRLIVDQQELPAFRVGARWRVRKSDLINYIRGHSQSGEKAIESKANPLSTSIGALEDNESQIRLDELSDKEVVSVNQIFRKVPFDDALLSEPPHFIGRDKELERLINRLRKGGMAGVTALRGLGGIGKTALAAVAVRRLHSEGCFQDGIVVILCQDLCKATDVIQRVLIRFDPQYREPEASDFADLAESAYQILNGKNALVVLDNIEPKLEVDKVISPLRSAGVTLLITSRHTLSHTVVPVDAVITLGLLSQEEALNLFAYSLGRMDAEHLTAEERVSANRIVEALDRHTLAVRLAGAYAADQQRDLEVFTSELEDPQRAIELPEGEMPHAVRRVFTQSTEALPQEAKKLFEALAIFGSTDFSRNAVVALAEGLHLTMPEVYTNLLVLRGLLDASVNTAMPKGSDHERVRLHPLLRALATSDFAHWEEEERNKAWYSLARYYAHYTNKLSNADLDPDYIGAGLGPDETSIIRALKWSHYCLQNEQVAAICSGMSCLWSDRYHTQASLEYIPWGIEAAEAIAKETKNTADLLRLAKLELDYGKVLQLTNGIDSLQGNKRINEARNYYEQSLAIARTLEDPQSIGVALYNLGRLARQLGDLDRAENLYNEALPFLRQADNERDVGLTLAFLGQIRFNRGDLKQAKLLYEESLSTHRKVGYRSGEGWVLGYLGQLGITYKRLDEAEHYYQQYLNIANELRHRRTTGVCQSFLGEIALLRKEYDKAESLLYSALDTFTIVQDPQSEGWALYFLGQVALAYQQHDKAEDLLRDALTKLDTANNLRGKSLVLEKLAHVAEIRDDLVSSENLYRQSLAISSKLQSRKIIADVQFELGRFLIERRDNSAEGYSLLIEAKQYYAEMGLPMEGKTSEIVQ